MNYNIKVLFYYILTQNLNVCIFFISYELWNSWFCPKNVKEEFNTIISQNLKEKVMFDLRA